MHIYNEIIPYQNPLLPVRIFRYRRYREVFVDWHYHKEAEMLLIIEGTLEVHVGDQFYSLNKGDVLLIGASELHRDRSYQGVRLKYVVFQFDIQQYFDASAIPYIRLFSGTNFKLSDINYIFRENHKARQAASHYILDIYSEMKQKKDGYEIAVSILIRQLLLLILRGDVRQLFPRETQSERERMKPVIDYIEKKLTDKINVEEASKIANMSYSHFLKSFKRIYGMTFVDYVNFQRVKLAERVLLTKDVNISNVGEEIGLPNMAHFYKIFRKFNHCSPNEFRKKMKHW